MVPILAALAVLAAASPDMTAALKAKSQALLDAVSDGSPQVWDALLAPEATYVDENGGVSSRAEMIKQVEPLPPGISGKITVSDDYRVEQVGDVAVAVFHIDEAENFHGQHLKARYLLTETWLRRDGDWKLLLTHTYATLWKPPAITLPPAALDAFVGRYQAAPDLTFVIARDGDHLVGGREGNPGRPLEAETADILFAPDQLRTRKMFQRDADGRITGFVDRREGVDITWRKLP